MVLWLAGRMHSESTYDSCHQRKTSKGYHMVLFHETRVVKVWLKTQKA